MPTIRLMNITRAVSWGLAILATYQDAQAGFISDWEASSGLLPNQLSPPYIAVSNGNATASLSGGALTISTVANSDQFVYTQNAPTVDTSAPFYIEAQLRLVSGQSSNAARGPAVIDFTTGAGVGNALWIDQGQVFFNTGTLVAGTKVNVDTTSFHTYHIDYDGNGGLSLLYDGSLMLTSHTYVSSSDFGGTKQISWGDGSVLASGTSQWKSFTHNALTVAQAVPEPSSCLLVSLGMALLHEGAGSSQGRSALDFCVDRAATRSLTGIP